MLGQKSMKSITTNAILEGVRSRKDGSLGLTVSTPELTPQEKALFMELQGINLELIMKPLDDVKVEDYKINKDLESKTQSQRLRAVLFILWKQDPEGREFEDYYKLHTEKIIEWLKAKIDQ
jgi:hypothetical protein